MSNTGSLGKGDSQLGKLTLGMVTDDPSTATSAFGNANATITKSFTAQVGTNLSIPNNIVPGLGSVSAAHGHGFALADIKAVNSGVGQAQPYIILTGRVGVGQAQAFINTRFGWGQAQAKLNSFGYVRVGQARAIIIPISGILGVYATTAINTNGTGSLVFFGTIVESAAHEPNYTSNLAGAPPGAPSGSNFNLHYHKWFTADQTGAWSFASSTDDGALFTIYDESLNVVGTSNNNYGGGQGQTYHTGTITLTSGVRYKFDFQYGQGGGGWALAAWYRRPSDVADVFLTDGNAPWMVSALRGTGQAQAFILGGTRQYGQAQAYIAGYGFGQANADIKATSNAFAQSQADIIATTNQFAQAQADILHTYQGYAQAQALLVARVFGQAQADILATTNKFAQSNADILATNNKFGQANADILQTYQKYGQAQAYVQPHGFGQAQAWIIAHYRVCGQAQAKINAFGVNGFGQAQATIFRPTYTYNVCAQAAGLIRPRNRVVGQAQADIRIFGINVYAQAVGYIGVRYATGQAQASVVHTTNKFAQAQAFIGTQVFAQAQALLNRGFGLAQAQATILGCAFAQSQARIYAFNVNGLGQALAGIAARLWQPGQAMGDISKDYWSFAQARAFIGMTLVYGMAMAEITPSISVYVVAQARTSIIGNYSKVGNAQAFISRTIKHGNAQGYIAYAAPGRLVTINNYVLPGYFIEEELTSQLRVNIVGVPYSDDSSTEQVGLENKLIRIRMLLAEREYRLNKEQVLLAATMLQSNREGWSKLTTMNVNTYYLVKTKSVHFEQLATSHHSEYEAVFEAQPWKFGREYTFTGTSQVVTTNRTLANGTWTPAILTVTGSDIVVSGYTATQTTTYVTVSGAVNNLVIDPTDYYSNRNDLLNPDYYSYIGPGQTTFDIIGATECTVKYRDRWEL